MNRIEITKALMKDFERGNADAMNTRLMDNFTLKGPTPVPVGKEQFIALRKAIVKGVPDWSFNCTEMREEGSSVVARVRITGTHTGTLDIPGFPVTPATGKRFQIPAETLHFHFTGDKVTRLDVDTGESGGLPGMFAQLGVEVEEMAMA